MIDDKLNLDNGHYYYPATQRLESPSNGGLFSNFYHCVWSLIDLHNQGYAVQKITFEQGSRLFRDESVDDLYPVLFKQDTKALSAWFTSQQTINTIARPDHHGVYELYPYHTYDHLINAYFKPSDGVKELTDYMRQKYKLDESLYAALYFRGTDKGTEVTLPDIRLMIQKVKAKMHAHDLHRCLVQTDDARILELGLESLPGAFHLEELPATSGDEGFHYQNARENVIPATEFAKRLCAMTHVLANASTIALPASNLAGWVCLLRTNTNRVIQYNKHGNEVSDVYRSAFKVKNMLRSIRAKVLNNPIYV